jgi:hypothetical protein
MNPEEQIALDEGIASREAEATEVEPAPEPAPDSFENYFARRQRIRAAWESGLFTD